MESGFGRVTLDPSVLNGQPCVRGLRIPVALVLKYLAEFRSAEHIVSEFPELEVEDVAECLRYAAYLASNRTLPDPLT